MPTVARKPAHHHTDATRKVAGGVDTHKNTHTAAVVDELGRLLAHQTFPATPAGYRALLGWLTTFGKLLIVGIEGTGSYGAGLARYLTSQQIGLAEIDRPDRKTRRGRGKSDPIDAEAAARAALHHPRSGIPKARDGRVEALRNLRLARRSAVSQRADVTRQLKSLLITAPDALRERLRGLSTTKLITACAGLRPDPTRAGEPEHATKIALRTLAHRHQHLSTEINQLQRHITPLVAAINPTMLALNGVGPDTAGQLLITAGENPDRIHTEAAFAMLCGVAPLPASSGTTRRHRLNRGGDRQANAALYRLTLSRLRWHPATQAYAQRRKTEGLSKPETIRCLKRYLAREIYTAITNP
jgi:transposase